MKALSLLLLLASFAQAAPEFVGFMTTREHGTLFAIVASRDTPPRWAKISDDVEGYRLVSFDPKEEALVLKKNGREFILRLKESKVRDGSGTMFEARIIESARRLVAKMDSWESDVVYQAAKTDDGFWYVFATKVVDGKKQVRRVRLTSDAMATNYSKLTVEEPK